MGTGCQRCLCTLHCAVTIRIGFNHRPQLQRAGLFGQNGNVVTQCSKVDSGTRCTRGPHSQHGRIHRVAGVIRGHVGRAATRRLQRP